MQDVFTLEELEAWAAKLAAAAQDEELRQCDDHRPEWRAFT